MQNKTRTNEKSKMNPSFRNLSSSLKLSSMKTERVLLTTISPALRIMTHTENGQKYVLNEAINE